MKTYNQLVKELNPQKSAVFTFGRMNPPSKGHVENINRVLECAVKNNQRPFIYLSQSFDTEKNPLTIEQRKKYLRLAIPEAKQYIVEDKRIKNPFHALEHLITMGYKNITFVVGEDRFSELNENMSLFLEKYFKDVTFNCVLSGSRNDSISSSKMREAAINDDFDSFAKNTPKKLNQRFKREMFDCVKRGLALDKILESISTINLDGMPREIMPQIPRKNIPSFLRYVREKGIKIRKIKVPVSSLRPAQNKICNNKVKKKYDNFENGIKPKPFIVSRDNYIMDGHHQLYALIAHDSQCEVEVYKIDLDMGNLLNIAKSYSGVRFEDLKSNPINKE